MPVLDRIVELQELRITRDRFGGEVESWSEIEKVWANVKQSGTSERFQNDADRAIALRNATIRIRWRGDVQETGRVVYDGFPWDIKGIAEIGFRRESWILSARRTCTGRKFYSRRSLTRAGCSGATTRW